MTTGIHKDLSYKEYASIPALNYSGIKEFAISPGHFKEPRQYSDPDGLVIHKVMELPHTWREHVVMKNRSTAEEKAKAEEEGLLMVPPKPFALAEKISDALQRPENLGLLSIIDKGESELVGVIEKDGLLMKGRFDLINVEDGIIYDFKSMGRGKTDKQLSAIVNELKWYWQAWWYTTIAEAIYGKKFTFANVVIEKEAPFGIRIIELDEASLDKAESEIMALIPYYKQCLENNDWPVYPEKRAIVSLPAWKWSEGEDDESKHNRYDWQDGDNR